VKPRRWVLAIALVASLGTVGLAGIVTAHATGDRSRDRSIPAVEARAAEQEAHTFWDNPFQRMVYLDLIATGSPISEDCPAIEVTACTIFGWAIDRVVVDCEGVSRPG
jgi:hypothetical protein